MVLLQRSTVRDGRAGDASPRWALPALDETQAAAAAHRGGRALVVGAPGTGKTTVAIAAVTSRVAEGVSLDACLVLAGSRVAAARLRDRISGVVGGTSSQPAARTPSSLAYGILRRRAVLEGLTPPRLLSGPEQDVILRELLAGHAAGAAPRPGWPDRFEAALGTRGFRSELRDLLMRAAERGVAPEDLAALGRVHGRPEWVAAARVGAEYEAVTALANPGGLDPAALLAAAADALDDDPGLLGESFPGLQAIVVDDAHELTPPGARLVAALAAGGADLLLIGDPDVGTQSFRGGDPRLFMDLAAGAHRYVLPHRWRQPAKLAAVTAQVAGRIGTVGEARHRAATPSAGTQQKFPARPGGAGRPDCSAGPESGGGVEVLVARSATQEARHVAEQLRRAHLIDGTPWSQMAVIVRGRARTATLRRVLTGAQIPLVLPGAQVPLREEPVVAALLELLRVSLAAAGEAPGAVLAGRDVARHEAGSGGSAFEATVVLDLLASPLAGVDASGVRRLRRALRAAEAPRGVDTPARSVDAALVAGLLGDGTFDRLGPEGTSPRRLARAVAAGAAAAAGTASAAGTRANDEPGGRGADVTAESVLWAIWSALGVGEGWRRTAPEGGASGERADRDLDAVVALFEAAARYVDRLPGRGPDGFLEQVLGQDVAGDLLAEAAPRTEAVTVTTPAGAAGSEWDVVAVCGVQEGVWPDVRLRGSVLGSQALVDLLAGRSAGPREALAAVRHDEARLFHVAVSRARRRLLVTATANEDEQPSAYLDLIDGGPPPGCDARPALTVPERMTAAGTVARLRRELATAPDRRRAGATARRLALLATEGMPGASPQDWWTLRETTDDRPRRDPEASVRVSPSRVEAFGNCPLRWLLSTAGGERPRSGGADAVGTLVHAIAAEVDNSDVAALQAELSARWPSLGLPPGWLSERALSQAREMLNRLARYDAQARGQGWRLVGREVEVSVSVGRAEIRGRIDRVEESDDGGVRVVDLKTGASKPRADDLPRHPQLGAYQAVVAAGGLDVDRSAGAALLQLGKAAAATKVDLQLQPPLSADDDPNWARRLLAETADGMAAGTFPARAGDWCRTCSGRSCCPASGEGEAI